MAVRTPTLHELCYPELVYIPRTPISPPTSAPARPTMRELCHPELYLVPPAQPIPADFHSECWIDPDLSWDHSDALSESQYFNSYPTPQSAHIEDDYDIAMRLIKEQLVALSHERPPDYDAQLLVIEEQLSQLEQLRHERDRLTALRYSAPLPFQTPDIPDFHQVTPHLIPSDSNSDYPIQFESEPNPSILPHVDNRSTLEQCLDEILRADELEQSNLSTSVQPVELISIQTSDIPEFHQVLPFSSPSDSIPDYPILSESESPIHLSSTPEFDIEELTDEDIHDLETIFQTSAPSIHHYLLDFMIQDPTTNTCPCLDGSFNDDPDTHTHSLDPLDNTSEDIHDDDESQTLSDHVEEIPHPELLDEHFVDDVIINSSSDYPIYDSTPDDPSFDPSTDDSCYEIDESHSIFPPFYEPSTILFFQDFFIHKSSDDPIYDDDSLQNLDIHTHSEEPLDYICEDVSVDDELAVVFDHVEAVVRWESFLYPGSEYLPSAHEDNFYNVLEIQVDHIEDIYIELQDVQDFLSNMDSSARRKSRRRGMKKVRRTRTKKERMMAKLTKRLSSSNSPLKRTRWNDGKRVREKRP